MGPRSPLIYYRGGGFGLKKKNKNKKKHTKTQLHA
jgi:hypothetical protein